MAISHKMKDKGTTVMQNESEFVTLSNSVKQETWEWLCQQKDLRGEEGSSDLSEGSVQS